MAHTTNGDCYVEDPDEDAENMLNMYEDLSEYVDCCFQDTDCLLLDEYTEEQLIASPVNEMMGITTVEDPNIIEFPVKNSDGSTKNIKATINISPWDLEDE